MEQLAGAITEADAKFVEEWESVSPAEYWVIHLDMRGNDSPQRVEPRRRFMIRTRDRLLTQSKIKDQADDPFTNGAFRPITVPDTITITTNPNALSDQDIVEIFQSSDLAWSEYMKVIDSPETVSRMVDLADQSESLTVRRLRELQDRLAALRPRTEFVEKDPHLAKFLADARRESVPSGSMRPKRRG